MRQLHLEHPVDDGTRLVLATADGAERFELAVDAALRDLLLAVPALAAQPALVAQPAQPVAPAQPTDRPLGPRDIQVRVRAGESPADLAAAHGMTIEQIMRFGGPVLAERARIADEARRARARRSTADEQVVVFGATVDARYAAHGIAPADVSWDAWRRDDGEWLVQAGWVGGDSTHTATWVFHRSSRTVTPDDDTAADLLSDRPIRPIAPVPPPEPVRSLSMAPPLVPGVVAFPPMPDAATGPLPVVADRAGDRAAEQTSEQVFDQFAQELPLGIVEPANRAAGTMRGLNARHDTEDERAARARVPSWDDILLGVRRKSD